MDQKNNNLEQRISDARPSAKPDADFVHRLRSQLKDAASEKAGAPAQPAKKSWSSWWAITGSALAGAAVATVVLVVGLNPDSGTPGSIGVNGYVQKGPFISGSEITVQELDNAFQPSGDAYQTATNSDFGDYSFTADVKSQTVEVIASGYYFNEVRGELSDSTLTLRGIANISDETTMNVNILTTLSAERIRYLVQEDNLSLQEAKKQAEQEVLGIFRIDSDDIGDFETMTLSENTSRNGVLVAVSAIMQGEQTVAQLSELTSKIALDIREDGTLDNPRYTTQLIEQATALRTDEVTKHLEQRYANLGLDIEIPAFETYVRDIVNFAVIRTQPPNAEDEVAHNQSIAITLNKRANEDQVNEETVRLLDGETSVPVEIDYNAEARTIYVTPESDLLGSRTYTVSLNPSLSADDGDALDAEYTFQFSTARLDTETGFISYFPFDGTLVDKQKPTLSAVATGGEFRNNRNAFPESAYRVDFDEALSLPSPMNLWEPSWTISFWLRPEDLTRYDEGYVLHYENTTETPDPNVHLLLAKQNGNLVLGSKGEGWSEYANWPLVPNDWYYVSLVYDAQSLKLYINGQQAMDTTERFTPSNPSSFIRLSTPEGSAERAEFVGIVDDIRMYNRPLNTFEIQSLYRN